MSAPTAASTAIYSIGHGNRSASDFVALLRAAGVACLVDVRAYPASRRHPQFTRMALEPALRAAGIQYLWEGEALGGMRRASIGSPHSALTDPTLRGFADHMASDAFRQALSRLLAGSRAQTFALMCAERDPLHCHRSFIADALLLHGLQVLHLHGTDDVRPHALRPEARRLDGPQIVYDGGVQLGLTL